MVEINKRGILQFERRAFNLNAKHFLHTLSISDDISIGYSKKNHILHGSKMAVRN